MKKFVKFIPYLGIIAFAALVSICVDKQASDVLTGLVGFFLAGFICWGLLAKPLYALG